MLSTFREILQSQLVNQHANQSGFTDSEMFLYILAPTT